MRRAAAFAVFSAAAALRSLQVFRRYADPDELEHLHASLLVARGALPFRDFFEHHGPALWLLLAPLARAIRDPYALLVAGRLLISVFAAGIVWTVFRLRPERDRSERLTGAALLAFFGAFSWKSLEIRPDVPALLALAGALAAASSDRDWAGYACGLCLGIGFWFTPKIAVPAAGLLAASAWRRGGRPAARFLFQASLGALAPAAAGLACFAAAGASGPLWRCLILFNARFISSGVPWYNLEHSIWSDPAVWALGACGLAYRRERAEEAGLLIGALAGYFLLPVWRMQSLLPAALPLALLAATAWSRTLQGAPRRSLPFAAWCAVFAWLAFVRPALLGLDTANISSQRARWDCSALARPDDRIADVWTGDSFDRPSADWLWFLPEDNQPQFSPAEVERRYVSALEDSGTRGLIWDARRFSTMPEGFVQTARRLYAPSGCGSLWLRRSPGLIPGLVARRVGG